ncbi:hypothetical protein KKE78_01895 [Patescibacteria group bacterium]|nr:hypothetical protein [Patescibacteria group bacterium]
MQNFSPNVSIALIRDGEVVWTEGFGVTNTITGEHPYLSSTQGYRPQGQQRQFQQALSIEGAALVDTAPECDLALLHSLNLQQKLITQSETKPGLLKRHNDFTRFILE